MRVALPVGKNQVRTDSSLHLLETILHLTAAVGQKTVPVVLEDEFFFAAGGEQLGRLCRLPAPRSRRAENHPVKPESGQRLL